MQGYPYLRRSKPSVGVRLGVGSAGAQQHELRSRDWEAAGDMLSPAIRAVLLALETRIAGLGARLAQYSGNSSRPP